MVFLIIDGAILKSNATLIAKPKLLSSPSLWIYLDLIGIVFFLSLYEYSFSNNQLSSLNESICNFTDSHTYRIWNDELQTYEYFNSLDYNSFCPPYPECVQDYIGTQNISNCP